MTNTSAAPTAAYITRVINALALQWERGMIAAEAGVESGFTLSADFDVTTWCPRVGVFVMMLRAVLADGTTSAPIRTVTVCPGSERPFGIVQGDRFGVGETRGVFAAFAIALEQLTAPVMIAHQWAHDPVAV